jgi:hypothetical protein
MKIGGKAQRRQRITLLPPLVNLRVSQEGLHPCRSYHSWVQRMVVSLLAHAFENPMGNDCIH